MIEILKLAGALAGVLAVFTGILFWAVKELVSSLKEDHKQTSESLQEHIDNKIEAVSAQMKAHADRIEAHEKQLQDQRYAQLQLRNEVLEDMRSRYVRRDDIVEIKDSIKAIFARMDRIIFKPGRDND